MNENEYLPMRGRWIFRQYFWNDRHERDEGWLRRGVIIAVQRCPEMHGSWCVLRNKRLMALLLRLWHGPATSIYWWALSLLWACGFFEPIETKPFSWRRDFRPFPWRGLRRERPRA